MSSIKNTNQKVSEKYDKNFVNIFGDHKEIPATGTYTYDKKSGKLIKIDKNIPKLIKDKMEPLTTNVRNIKPINIITKG